MTETNYETNYEMNAEMGDEKDTKQQAYPKETKHKVKKNHAFLADYKTKPWFKPGILLVAGIFLMSLSSVLSGGNTDGDAYHRDVAQESVDAQNLPSYMQIEQQLEAKLERTISGVAGVDHVLVSVTLDSSMAKDYAIDVSTVSKTQQEQDAGGVQRIIAEQTDNQQLVLEKGGATPIIIKESMPQVRGVAVVATGVDNAATREEVFHIVQGLLDVPAHKIIITNGKGKE